MCNELCAVSYVQLVHLDPTEVGVLNERQVHGDFIEMREDGVRAQPVVASSWLDSLSGWPGRFIQHWLGFPALVKEDERVKSRSGHTACQLVACLRRTNGL